MNDDVIEALRAYEPELIAIRRDIHQHPETGFEEVRTAALVRERLEEWGIETHIGLGRTGVVGTIRGTRPGQRAVALRADMDALHIQEQTSLPYASEVAGKMHACGHDGHTAMLLGAARYLSEHRDFGGTVHFVFQPAEEGLGGAREMMRDGLFEKHPADAIYGMHAIPGLPAKTFHIRPGQIMASSDAWAVTFKGTGGHGSAPHKGTDPTIPLAHFVLGLQTVIGRNIDPLDSAVISVGYIEGGMVGSPNIIPAAIVVRGTTRTFTPAVRDLLEQRLTDLARGLALSHGCEAAIEYRRNFPSTFNAADQTEVAVAAAIDTVGDQKVDARTPPLTGSEDFSFMLEQKAGAYIFIGNGEGPHVHTPLYDFNDDILITGSAYWVNLAHRELGLGQG